MVRNSAKIQAQQNNLHRNQQHAAATRNLYNRQQPLQFDQSQPRQQRNYGSFDNLNGYGPVMGSASNGRGSNSEVNDDEDGASSLGPNFGANFESADNDGDGEGRNANNGVSNLNQAASGYPTQDVYNNDGLGFGFGAGDSFTSANAEFAPNENFGNEGRRSKSASSPLGSRGFGVEDDAGAPQFGPNSAVNSDGDDDDRSSYTAEGADNDNDDE